MERPGSWWTARRLLVRTGVTAPPGTDPFDAELAWLMAGRAMAAERAQRSPPVEGQPTVIELAVLSKSSSLMIPGSPSSQTLWMAVSEAVATLSVIEAPVPL